jgi:hypothetical protein
MKAKPSSKSVEDAIHSIAGTLALLNEKERGAVLSRINGAFGFNTSKGGSGTGRKRATKERKKPEKEVSPPPQKNAFNAAFGRTIDGVMLTETSKRIKELSKNIEKKVSPSLHAVHSALLSKKNEAKLVHVKAGEHATSLPVAEHIPGDPSELVDGLISAVDTLNQVIQDNQLPSTFSPVDIVSAGSCLIQGYEHPLLTKLKGKIPNRDAWVKAPSALPRSAEEKAKRTLRLVALKEQSKEGKKRKIDSETAARSSDQGRVTSPKTFTKDNPKEEKETVDMDQST